MGVSVECKGTHEEIVHEVIALLDALLEHDGYRNDIFHIIDDIIENEIEQLKKENK